MHMTLFKALVLDQKEGNLHRSIQELKKESLPPGEVLVSVAYSSLNYKDALAITGRGKIIRNYPMVPGIDLAGTVIESSSPQFKPQDKVLLTGCGIGEEHWGGYAQLARVRSDWLIPLPKGLSLKQAMGIGTAGFTSMLSIMALEAHGIQPSDREIIVTGATGGVGSIAVAILAKLGYRVVASTGKLEAHSYLKELGAQEILDRKTLINSSNKPLESQRWGGAIDTVGGKVLASLLPAMVYGSSVTTCGMAGGSELNTTVFPFILRGVNLLGISSVHCPHKRRCETWERLARDLPLSLLEKMIQTYPLEKVPELSEKMLRGETHGRIVIDLK